MSNQASTSDIASYLTEVKKLLSAGKYDFVPRRKNMQALAQHGLTITDAKNEILGLVVGDYYKGPKQDHDPNRPGDIWEFKKDIDGMQFYVKVKIVQENGEDILKCIGFHEDGVGSVARDGLAVRVAQLVHADVVGAHGGALGGEVTPCVPVLEEEGQLDLGVRVGGVDDADGLVGDAGVLRDGVEEGVGDEPGFLAVCFHDEGPFCM